ncbi:MAG: hypothetical protein MJA83_15960, partial [Gammaproteobacteria bacterium]|nr:hypothetical protein [Gammaproteobacteria bacterium]
MSAKINRYFTIRVAIPEIINSGKNHKTKAALLSVVCFLFLNVETATAQAGQQCAIMPADRAKSLSDSELVKYKMRELECMESKNLKNKSLLINTARESLRKKGMELIEKIDTDQEKLQELESLRKKLEEEAEDLAAGTVRTELETTIKSLVDKEKTLAKTIRDNRKTADEISETLNEVLDTTARDRSFAGVNESTAAFFAGVNFLSVDTIFDNDNASARLGLQTYSFS